LRETGDKDRNDRRRRLREITNRTELQKHLKKRRIDPLDSPAVEKERRDGGFSKSVPASKANREIY